MAENVARKLIREHLVEGEMTPGTEIGLRVDQTLTQDATGTLVMLELAAMELPRVVTELSVQYVDHNLVQADNKNADDHVFLWSACRRFGLWFSRPGGGVSHPVHMERFGVPGKMLLGSDSHTCAAGALGMLAMGAGGLEVALAMAGEPYRVAMPRVLGVRLVGRLPEWVSAKDVVLEMLRRRGVSGGVGRVIEYRGEGVATLSAMDRHVIANMGAELGATTSVFPSDAETRRFLASRGRAAAWREIAADEGALYDEQEEIDLARLEPLIAKPSSPGDVVAVREIAGAEIQQAYLGSSANPGFRDFAIAALMVRGRRVDARVSFDVNPTSRDLLEDLVRTGLLADLVHAGARIHQAGCNGCIGMGQAPATGRRSLRTVPRNFPGRSGTREDAVYLCSPETAAASALTGVITDPRELGIPYPHVEDPEEPTINPDLLVAPPPPDEALKAGLVFGPNIKPFPEMDAPPDDFAVPVLLKCGDDVSTDEISPAGARVLPYRSNIEKMAEFAFEGVDPEYPAKARAALAQGGHVVVAGRNYGQGSSREHAALVPRKCGLRLVLAKSFARIHRQNLVNFGVLPATFVDATDYDRIAVGDGIAVRGLRRAVASGPEFSVEAAGRTIRVRHGLSARQVEIFTAGGLIPLLRRRTAKAKG